MLRQLSGLPWNSRTEQHEKNGHKQSFELRQRILYSHGIIRIYEKYINDTVCQTMPGALPRASPMYMLCQPHRKTCSVIFKCVYRIPCSMCVCVLYCTVQCEKYYHRQPHRAAAENFTECYKFLNCLIYFMFEIVFVFVCNKTKTCTNGLMLLGEYLPCIHIQFTHYIHTQRDTRARVSI